MKLYVVYIDTNMGLREPDWCQNDSPLSLWEALQDAARCRRQGFPTYIRVLWPVAGLEAA